MSLMAKCPLFYINATLFYTNPFQLGNRNIPVKSEVLHHSFFLGRGMLNRFASKIASMNLLKINNLTKTYPNGIQALKGINLEISNGMFGLLGPNGSGKSTLMRTIASLQQADEGFIFFNEINTISEPQYMRENIGYLPQEFGVYPHVSCEKLLHHIAILKGITNKEQRQQQIDALLYQTNLYEHRKRAVYGFSGGMRRRFGIAQALLGNPQLIVVDEPTAGLDPDERNRFLNLLSEIGEQVIVILSTHIVEDVNDLCTRMAILHNGKIIRQGQPEALVRDLIGKVWVKQIDKKELPRYKADYQVLSSRFHAGILQVQIYAAQNPGDGFTCYTPNLESVYFFNLLQHKS